MTPRVHRVLVTGASGFVGTHLLEALIERGIQTTALYRSSPPQKEAFGLITWAKCDLTTDDIGPYLQNVDVVFHLAGYSGLGSDPDTVKQLNSVNVVATKRVGTAALAARCRFIYVSSIHACEASSEYGRSKRRAEDAIVEFGRQGLDFTILRSTQLFGEYHEGSVLELARAIKRRQFFLIGDPSTATNFYYVKDFVDALLRVAEHPACKQKTYIAADHPLPLSALAEQICQQVGAPLPKFRVPRSVAMMVGSVCDAVSSLSGRPLPLSRSRVQAMTRDVRYSNRQLVEDIGPRMPYGVKIGLGRAIEWYASVGLL